MRTALFPMLPLARLAPLAPLALLLASALACSSAPSARARAATEAKPVAAPTDAAAARETCFILREVDGPLRVREGGDTCARRVWPASTFKVPHTLLALETGARTGPDDREAWDGAPVFPEACAADQTLATALQRSCVWYYKRTATKIGRARMAEGLAAFHYGNAAIGEDLTSFWLQGPLTISADEQADFMERLARRTLPVAPAHMIAVDAMMLQEPGTFRRSSLVPVGVTWDPKLTTIHAKSGSADDDTGAGPNVRWFTGHLTAAGRAYAFASLVLGRGELGGEALTQAAAGLAAAGLVRRTP